MSQLDPSYMVHLTPTDRKKLMSKTKLLCNWRNCTLGPRGKPAVANRLCPFCHRVGYCCEYCLQQDIYGHVSHNCPQNIKKAKVVPAPIKI